MNRDEAKRLLLLVHFIEAFAEGKVVQHQTRYGLWEDVNYPSFSDVPKNYRIKPELRTFYINNYGGSELYIHTSHDGARKACDNRKDVETIKVMEVL